MHVVTTVISKDPHRQEKIATLNVLAESLFALLEQQLLRLLSDACSLSQPAAGGRRVSICSDLCYSDIGPSDFCNNMF
jgi:hypothetical protein